ncbi:MAG: sugar ABC transporter substrate-binding protein [Clostridiales bacterium]|nr:sugar ABC transporter substrate-binding protein [Clostridiales bacterium]
MKLKKLLGLLLALTMVMSLLAGCGSDGEKEPDETKVTEGTGETKDTETEDKETEGDVEGAEISLSVWNEPHKDDALNMYLAAEKATGVKINVNVIPETEYSSKLNQMVATGDDSIDIYIVWENDISNFAQAKGIDPLDDYLSGSSIDSNDFIDAVANLTDGLGATYGLPWCAATEILYYNQDMFDEAGLEYPNNDWAYNDFLVAAEKLTKLNADGTTDIYGFDLPNLQTWWAGIGIKGDQIYDPATGKLVIGDGAVSFIKDCADMAEKGVMPVPSSDTSDNFGSGKAAMSWQGSWMIGSYADGLDFNWDIATIPTAAKKYNTLHTGFYTINSNSKNKEAAWKVIEFLMGEEGQRINSQASGNPSALVTIANKGEWKVEAAKTVENWDAMIDSLESGIFGYTCIPAGVTGNAVSLFNTAVSGQITPEDAVKQAMEYAADTIGYTLD